MVQSITTRLKAYFSDADPRRKGQVEEAIQEAIRILAPTPSPSPPTVDADNDVSVNTIVTTTTTPPNHLDPIEPVGSIDPIDH
jgi:hypothetical protein